MPRSSSSSSSLSSKRVLLSAAFAAFVFFSMLSASSASRPLGEVEPSSSATSNSRALKQFNSTQRTGPWFPITGTTASSMPGYFPRLNLTRNATASQIAQSALPLTTSSSFPGQSVFPPAAVRSGNSGLQSGGLSGIENFDGTPIVETTGYSN